MSTLNIVGLFAGIGGIEAGLARAGHHSRLLCEVDRSAQAVLSHHFNTEIHDDVRTLKHLPAADLLAAGFPCQDLSQAGGKRGINGERSRLVHQIFRLIRRRATRPKYLLIENVSYMLRLDRGRAMNVLVEQLERYGYRWAYRVVDARAFGVPQRRQRVLLLAALEDDPRRVLFADDSPDTAFNDTTTYVDQKAAYGFYWTEGLRGLGWTKNAVPTVKGGSSIGIPSPPAVWVPATAMIGTPQIEDAERLQGFAPGWTQPAESAGHKRGSRWRLVGNAVCVDMAAWVGHRLLEPGTPVGYDTTLIDGARWPIAAWGEKGIRRQQNVSMHPKHYDVDIETFLSMPLQPLSVRAARGFHSRAMRSTTLNFPRGFLRDVEARTRL